MDELVESNPFLVGLRGNRKTAQVNSKWLKLLPETPNKEKPGLGIFTANYY